ncbi:MAG: hypothetical protein K1X48_10685 [Burkholderiaceae bacterium]|nr:hypothetical protein [Burkholderiaceae bacterium]
MAMQMFNIEMIQALVDKYAQEGSKVFDAEAYKAKYLTDPNDPLFSKPLEHFLTKGAALGYNPLGNFPLKFFDADFYAKKYEELGKLGVDDPGDKFGHYLLYGMGEGRQASQDTNNFNSEVYLKMYPAIEAYVKDHLSDFNNSLSNGALAHFIKYGAFQGFVGPIDDLASNDTYSFDHLANLKNRIELTDNPKDDRDTLQLSNNAVNFNGSGEHTISLESLNNAFRIDFDVLDLSLLTSQDLIIKGDTVPWRDTTDTLLSAQADDLMLGNPYLISSVEGFQDLLLTDTTLKYAGTSYVLDTVKEGKLTNGGGEAFFDVDVFTAGIDASLVSQGVTLRSVGKFSSIWLVGSNYNDTLTGGDENNLIRGGAGRDVMNGGGGSNIFEFKGADSTLDLATADIVNGFDSGKNIVRLFNPDGKEFVAVAAGVGINYIKAALSDVPTSGGKVANFTEALTAANKALSALNANISASTGSLVTFQYDANNGYLFQDVDGNGTADQVIILTGIDSGEFTL